MTLEQQLYSEHNLNINYITMTFSYRTDFTAEHTTKHAKINVNDLPATTNLTLSLHKVAA
jgi:hypothetical protein